MLNYWKADAYRLLRTTSFWVLVVISPIIYIVGTFMISGKGYTEDAHSSVLMISVVLGLIFTGLGIFNTLYSQDIKAGAMRVAIGRGTGRGRIVIAKFVENIVVSLLCGAVFYAVVRFVPLLFGIPESDEIKNGAAVALWQIVFSVVLFSVISSILSFARQESVVATVVFVLLAAGVIDQILTLLLKMQIVTSLVGDLTGYLPQGLSASLASSLGMGKGVGFAEIAVYVCYLVVGLALSVVVFKRKELEF